MLGLLSQDGLPCSQRFPNHSWLLGHLGELKPARPLALAPCSLISLSSPVAPLLQLPGLSRGLSKAEHLGRQFLLFRKIACHQGPMRAGFCLSCFHLSWPLPTGPTLGAQLRHAVCVSPCIQSTFAGARAW